LIQTYELEIVPRSSTKTVPVSDTRTALLDAAERLFSKQGVEATSVRQIVKDASANLGAITYHFGTKDRLALEVFARTLEPMNRQRLAELEVLEKAAKGKPIKLEKILETFIRSAVEDEASRQRRAEFIQLLGRCFQERREEIQSFMLRQFGEVVKRYDDAILRALPGLAPQEFHWRMSFLMGGLHHALEEWSWFDASSGPALPNRKKMRISREDLVQTFIAFAAAGLRAKAAHRSKSRSRR
jgi:AcrR family transcriptional regulator